MDQLERPELQPKLREFAHVRCHSLSLVLRSGAGGGPGPRCRTSTRENHVSVRKEVDSVLLGKKVALPLLLKIKPPEVGMDLLERPELQPKLTELAWEIPEQNTIIGVAALIPPQSLQVESFAAKPVSVKNTKTTHQEEEWYHGLLPREDTQRLLHDEGHYLVRVTEPSPGMGMMSILSVKWKGKPHHFILQEKNDKILLEQYEFNTIYELVTTLAKEKRQLNDYGVMLLKPVRRQEWELQHSQVELGKLLGEGAFGGVYAGILTTTKDKIKVAVKENKGKEASKKQIEEICKEARIMRRYNNPNVVRFFGVAVEREPIWLVMESVDGGALDSYLRKNKNDTTIKDQVSFSFSSAKGMDYLHSKGCIHRDVAARNCLVDTKTMTAKISDFGLSRELRDRAAKYKLKDLKQRLPIRWLAPEVLLAGTYSYKSDVYAFGVLLWEIFAYGEIPMKEMSLGEVNQAVKDGKRPMAPSHMPKFLRDVMTDGCFPALPENRWPMAKIRSTIEEVVESWNPHEKNKSCMLKTSRQTL